MPKPTRVMQVVTRLNVGGVASHVVLLAHHLTAPDFQTIVVSGQVGDDEGDMGYLAETYGIEPIYVAGLGRELSPLQDLFALLRLIWLMLRYRPQIVHTHTAKAGFLGRVAAILTLRPVRVHTYHGHVFAGYFSPRKTQFFLTLEQVLARYTARLITVSRAIRDELVTEYQVAPPEKFLDISLGLDLTPLATVKQQKHFAGDVQSHFRVVNSIPQNAQVVGIIGRLVPIKNHTLFLEAAYILAQIHPKAYFVIAGDGECRAEIESLIHDNGLQNRVFITGWVRDVSVILKELDCLALTSHNEGTPVSVIEAMAAGVPVVATNVGGVGDVLEGGRFGHLVPPDDPDALADAILKTLNGNHPDTILAQQAALALYDISRLTDDIRNLYQSLVQRKSS